jgi:hypothetical protein
VIGTHPTQPSKTRLVLLLSLLMAFWWLGQAPADAAMTNWRCGQGGCKYDQFRVTFDGATVLQHQYFGSIASPCGNPPNDGIRWYLQNTSLFEGNTLIYQTGGAGWQTNSTCNNTPPPPFWSSKNVQKTATAGNRSSHMWNWHDHACAGCDWQGYVRHDF